MKSPKRQLVVLKGGKEIAPVEKPKQPQTEKPAVKTRLACDREGREYWFDPKAKPPYSGHSIIYKDAPDQDEDIPLQNGREDQRGINGASPYLLIAAATQDLKHRQTRLPFKHLAVEYLNVALALLNADEDFFIELNKIVKSPTPEEAEEIFVVANEYANRVQSTAHKQLNERVNNLMFNVTEAAEEYTLLPTATLKKFKKIIPVT